MKFGPNFTGLHSSPKERQLQKSCFSFEEECTSTKDVHQFRYFLLMNTYCCLLMYKCIKSVYIRALSSSIHYSSDLGSSLWENLNTDEIERGQTKELNKLKLKLICEVVHNNMYKLYLYSKIKKTLWTKFCA